MDVCVCVCVGGWGTWSGGSWQQASVKGAVLLFSSELKLASIIKAAGRRLDTCMAAEFRVEQYVPNLTQQSNILCLSATTPSAVKAARSQQLQAEASQSFWCIALLIPEEEKTERLRFGSINAS